ncbi:MAG TPA: Xaa-Pro peptidase family protein [Methanoregula sp.]|nr:Xaa-Pro peptidase family protein [Methanoregula sp.]
MNPKVPLSELTDRLIRFRHLMDARHPDWEIAIIFSKLNLYYFTGTMQDGMLLVPRHGEACLWVRRSFERAEDESLFPRILQMRSYRDAAASMTTIPDTVYLETEQVPLALFRRLQKHFPFRDVVSIDKEILQVRSVKSPYELALMEQAGDIHRRVLEDLAPEILREGMSEAAFTSELYSLMVSEGHHGIVRFGTFESEIILGLIGFGESSLYPTYLDSPGGNAGMSPAVPLFGSRDRKLRDGDLVFVDIGCGFHGYHTDKTMTYVFGRALPDEAVAIHRKCVEIQDAVIPLLKPGAVPSQIYETIMATLEPAFLENFMGYGNRNVQFLGHGIGLEIAENPVIARGFDDPLEEGMVIAIEPKKGIRGIGMVGIENTFIVTPAGGRSITGHHPGLIPVG